MYIDFQKPFDIVPHEALLFKLERLGILDIGRKFSVPNIKSVHCIKPLSFNTCQVSDTSFSDTKKTVMLFEEDLENNEVAEEECAPNLSLNDWVVVSYESVLYPGLITRLTEDEAEVAVMHKAEGHFKWPKEDKIFYSFENIVKKISAPVPVGNRGQFTFIEDIQEENFLCITNIKVLVN